MFRENLVSIALASGAALAQSQADLVVANPSLLAIGEAIELARRTRRIIRQNIGWSIAYNAVTLPLALGGFLTPWLACLGMSLSSLLVVANALRLLKLAPEVQAHVRDGRLSVGHAKVILGPAGHPEQRLAADRVLRKSLNVRQTEELVADLLRRTAVARPATGRTTSLDPHVDRVQNQLRERLGTKVELRYRQGRRVLHIHFFSDDDLARVLELLGIGPD